MGAPPSMLGWEAHRAMGVQVWLYALALFLVVDGAELRAEQPAGTATSQAASEIESLYQEIMAMPQLPNHHAAAQVPEDELIEVPVVSSASPVGAAKPTAAPQQATPQQATPQQATPQQAAPQQAATQQAATQQAATQQAAPQQAATQQAAPQPAMQQTLQEQKQKAQKATAAKKLHQAQDFNQLVKNVNAILGNAMLRMKRDRKLFQKAQSDADQKKNSIAEAAEQAKQEAKGDETRIAAIETHVSLAQQENAKALIAFATKFRHTATHTFWKSYNKAKKLKAQLSELYDSITSHVGRAVNAMRRKRGPLENGYFKNLKAYFKVRYGGCGKESKQNCARTKKTAKNKMKAARAALLSFKTNLRTAHRHGKKLHHRLHSAIAKLHFVFKQAREEERKSEAAFHAGFDAQYSARKTVSLTALKQVKQRLEEHSRVQPQPNTKSLSTSDAVSTAATAFVRQAAKVIKKQKVETSPRSSGVATSAAQRVVPTSRKVEKKAVEINAEKKVVNLLKKVVKQATTTVLKQQPEEEKTEQEVPPKLT